MAGRRFLWVLVLLPILTLGQRNDDERSLAEIIKGIDELSEVSHNI